jgi:hypothetical protein
MKNLFLTLALLLLTNTSDAQVESIVCEATTPTSTYKVMLNPKNLTQKQVMIIADYTLSFGLLLKFGDYDSYPNVVLTVFKDNRAIYRSVMVGNNDEYGSFSFGINLENHGRCDAI